MAPSQGAIPALSHVTVLAAVQLSRWLLFSLHSGSASSSALTVFFLVFFVGGVLGFFLQDGGFIVALF